MSLAVLQQRKQELKQQLKLYDMNFHAQHRGMPEKREKEQIRHLYGSYNAYKNQISVIEKGKAQPGPGTAAFQGISDSPITSPATPGNVSSADEAAASLAQKPNAATSPAANGPPHLAWLSSEGTDNSVSVLC